jgi:hypothetical protein
LFLLSQKPAQRCLGGLLRSAFQRSFGKETLYASPKARDAISIFSLPGRIGITGILSSNWCRVRFCLGCTLRELDLAP